jgi:NADPH:quinone reductase-like Zn-dependent oxidoreductase
MKIIGFNQTGSVSNIEVLDVPTPEKPKEGEVRLKFLAGSLNHLDLWVIKGLPHLKYQFPHIAGSDFCGRVIESRSEKFKAGDRVLVYPGGNSGADKREHLPENLRDDFLIRGENSPGVLREELVEPEKYMVKCPQHLSDEEAGAVPLAYLTAWQMLEKGFSLGSARDKSPEKEAPQKIEPVLVHAVGSGVSQAILELLLSFGFKKIAATSRQAGKLEIWKKRGVQGFVSGQNLENELKSWSGTERFGIIFDHVGQSYFEMNIRLLRKGGRFVTCGATTGPKGQLDLRYVFFKQLQVLGSTMGSLKQFEEMVNWVGEKKIVPHVSHVFPFDNPKAAYETLETGRQDGKIVLSKTA